MSATSKYISRCDPSSFAFCGKETSEIGLTKIRSPDGDLTSDPIHHKHRAILRRTLVSSHADPSSTPCIQPMGVAEIVAYSLRTNSTMEEMGYSTPDCNGTATVIQYSSSTVRSSTCIDSRKINVNQPVYMSPTAHITEIYYTDSTCTTVSWVQFKPKNVFAVIIPKTCVRNANGLYYTRHLYETYDDDATASSIFASQTKTIFGSQTTNTTERDFYDSNCVADYGVSAYRADGNCINFGGTSGKVSINKDGTYVRTIYDMEYCNGNFLSRTTLTSNKLNTGECQDSKKIFATYAETPAPTAQTPQTPESTVQSVRTGSAYTTDVSVAAIMTTLATIAASVLLN